MTLSAGMRLGPCERGSAEEVPRMTRGDRLEPYEILGAIGAGGPPSLASARIQMLGELRRGRAGAQRGRTR